MGLLSWFGNADAKSFGVALADDLGRRFPPSSLARSDAGATQQLRGIVEGIGMRAGQYCVDKRAGLVGKAALANGFRWRLVELGYDAGFAEQVTTEVAKRAAVS